VGADFLWNSLEVLRVVVDRSGQRDVLRDRLPELAMPTLIVWGERDRVVPLAQARDAVGRLRRARLVVIPDCGQPPADRATGTLPGGAGLVPGRAERRGRIGRKPRRVISGTGDLTAPARH